MKEKMQYWAKMFKKALVDEKKQRFDEVPASNDVTFVSHMAYYSQKIELCDKTVYKLTYRKGSITRGEKWLYLLLLSY